MYCEGQSSNRTDASKTRWRIGINSIGAAGAGIIKALRRVSPLSESALARLLYQAPSVLFKDLSRELAENLNQLLQEAGLDSEVLREDAPFAGGDAEHELALVVSDMRRMPQVMQLVSELLWVNAEKARQILCTSPTVLLGKVSANTVAVVKRRFAPLGVQVDVSRPKEALFDMFLARASTAERNRLKQVLSGLRLPLTENGFDPDAQPLLATGLGKADADRVWERLYRSNLPVRLINRDFQRFDIRLEQGPESPEFLDFLVSTTGMPAHLAPKVLKKTPIVTHPNVTFAQMTEYLESVSALGGSATAHLLAFQTFGLCLERVNHPGNAARILQGLAGLSQKEALAAVAARAVNGPLTPPQARWLVWELQQAGTTAKMVMR